jgi:hypothetical protein
MATIQERNAVVRQIIRLALGDEDLEDEELLERAQICACAAMSIISTIEDDDVFEEAIGKFLANDQAVQREIRAAVDRLTHVDDEATTFAEALAREHANILLVAKELERRRQAIQAIARRQRRLHMIPCPRGPVVRGERAVGPARRCPRTWKQQRAAGRCGLSSPGGRKPLSR